MTEKQKETLAGGAVLVVLLLLIIWALFHAFGGAAKSVLGGPTYNMGDEGGVGGVTIDPSSSPYLPADNGGGCCGGCGGGSGCPVSPSSIQSVNQILQTGAAATNSIYAAGNATLQAMEDIYNAADPMYAYTSG